MTERKVKLDRANKSILLRALGDVYYGQRANGGSAEVIAMPCAPWVSVILTTCSWLPVKATQPASAPRLASRVPHRGNPSAARRRICSFVFVDNISSPSTSSPTA